VGKIRFLQVRDISMVSQPVQVQHIYLLHRKQREVDGFLNSPHRLHHFFLNFLDHLKSLVGGWWMGLMKLRMWRDSSGGTW